MVSWLLNYNSLTRLDAKVINNLVLMTPDPFLQVYKIDICKGTGKWFCIALKTTNIIIFKRPDTQ